MNSINKVKNYLHTQYKGEPNLCNILVIGALKPFLDRN